MKRWIQRRADRFHRSPESMRGFYDRIQGVYGLVERHLGPALEQVLEHLDRALDLEGREVLEYCSGSGLLTLKLAERCQTVVARDLSAKMLERARRRANGGAENVTFEEGNALDIPDEDGKFDYAFVSFGLHLFSPKEQVDILRELLRVTRREVVIIDHAPKWEFHVALVEWWEGSHYNQFINANWRQVSDEIGAGFSREIIADCQVQRWSRRS